MNFLKKDFKEEARVARRRQAEGERKLRIFDAKTRLIGVDITGLDRQRHEKHNIVQEAKRCEEEYTKKRLHEDKVCVQLEKQIEEQKRSLAKEIKLFQDQYQNPATRREFDLNDPDLKKKLKYTDDISFEGEDSNRNQRLKEQKAQNRAWLLQQIDDKRRMEHDLKTLMDEMTTRHAAYNERAKRLAALEETCRKKIDEATAKFNKLLATEKSEATHEETNLQAKIEATEIANWVTGDFLTENPERARSAFGPGRVITMMYKGEPPEKAWDTKKTQRQQTQEKQVRKHEDERDHKTWENYHEALYKQAYDKEQEIMKEQRRLNDRIVRVNSQMAHQQLAKEAERNCIADLHPTPKFFDQFNRTTY